MLHHIAFVYVMHFFCYIPDKNMWRRACREEQPEEVYILTQWDSRVAHTGRPEGAAERERACVDSRFCSMLPGLPSRIEHPRIRRHYYITAA